MTPIDWFGAAVGVAAIAAFLALGWLGLRGGEHRCDQRCRLICPHSGDPVDVRMEVNVRNGQWTRVAACSAFAEPEEVDCDRECLRQLNLGSRVPLIRHA